MDGTDLTQRQRAILDFIVESVERRGYPPAVREIGEAVGLASPSTVHAHLQSLEDKGYLRRDPTKPRAIEVRWGEHATGERPAAQTLPIYGSIAAGPTSLAEQVQEGTLAVPREFVDDTPHFVLRVRGESMIEAHICDGDLVLVRRQESAQANDIVVALLESDAGGDAEATVKRYLRDGARIVLKPENRTMKPIVVDPRERHVRILGKVIGLLRGF